MTFDTIVIGLGGMGSATAYQLARRGQRVLGLEKFGPAHAQGSSHGHSRVIRQSYFEDPAYVPLLLRAYELWRQLEEQTGENLLTITGGLMIGAADSEVVRGSMRSAREHGLSHEMLDAAAIRRRFPGMTPTDSEIAFYETVAGIVRPEKGVQAHLSMAEAHGAELHYHEPVLHWEANDRGVRVTTEQGTYTAERLVIAPGAWASHLFQYELPLTVTRQVLYWFEPAEGISPFLPDRFPVYIWEMPGGDAFYGFPAQIESGAPGGVKVAFYYRANFTEPDAVDRTVRPEEVEAMRDALRTRIPSLAAGTLQHTVCCLYTTTPDGHFAIGLHPAHPNVVLASPCSGHGYKFCSVMGEVLADLATEGTTPHPIGLFALDRFSAK